jgi:hypothetical protein
MMPKFRIFDTIPFNLSGEQGQDSEPSLAVDPLDPTQIFSGAFGFTSFFKSTSSGTAWFDDGTLIFSDKSLAWKEDGSGARCPVTSPSSLSIRIERPLQALLPLLTHVEHV